jgi:DNA-binding CsgD family transcriptional regulator/tetratricopeptide (TPR) repeat protein
MLLEREASLAKLDGCLSAATRANGRLVLVAGEAGVGKTSLLKSFADRHREETRLWWGNCDDLSTPGPLGPVHDIARQAGGELATLLAGGHQAHEIFAGVLRALISPPTILMVCEDVQWADQATLDLLVFLGRRVEHTNSVVLVTYRDDEVTPEHPLRVVLGRLAALPAVTRISLQRLSERATATLVSRHGLDPGHAYRVTGGNPFFLTELLAAPAGTVPQTVRDAVLLRVSQLSARARVVLNAVSVIPDGAELSLVAAITGDPDRAPVAECEQVGILRIAGRTVSFQHELARQAVEQAVPASLAPDLHTAVLAHLAAQPEPDPARLAYHAERAHDWPAVLRHAPAAAARASRLGAHREALAHYRLAADHAADLPPAQRAELLEAFAEECSPTGRIQEAIDALNEAAALREELGEVDGYAKARARQAQYLYITGRDTEAGELADKAIARVQGARPSPALAAAYAHAAYLGMLREDAARTLELGVRAEELAEQFEDDRLLSVALLAIGNVLWRQDPDRAEAILVRAVEAAHRSNRVAGITSALGETGVGALEARRYQCADLRLAEAVEWAVRHDLDASRDYFRAAHALSHFDQGRWPAAAELAAQLTGADGTLPPARVTARMVQARLAVRRGESDQATPLNEVWEAATGNGAWSWLWRAAAARAEAAWFAGQAAAIPALVGEAFGQAIGGANPWAVGELGFWLWRAGSLSGPPDGAAEPYVLHMSDEASAAARAWDRLGCPYEAAIARGDSDEPELLRSALEVLYQLGARPAANRLVHRMRRLGITKFPRRPHRSTGANPAGLTDRELEVAALLAREQSNADIAASLHISPRTAGHHVAAIMSKLEVPTRRDAARVMRQLDSDGTIPSAL